MLTEDELKAIEERERAATEGPWTYRPEDASGPSDVGKDWGPAFQSICDVQDSDFSDVPLTEQKQETTANGEFIACARTDIPALLAHIREQAAELDKVRGEINTKPRPDDIPKALTLPRGAEIEDACKLIGDDPENWEPTGFSILGVEYRRKTSP